jgi:hypothetical protein
MQLDPTVQSRRNPDQRADKPEEQPGLLWNKFRSEPAE